MCFFLIVSFFSCYCVFVCLLLLLLLLNFLFVNFYIQVKSRNEVHPKNTMLITQDAEITEQSDSGKQIKDLTMKIQSLEAALGKVWCRWFFFFFFFFCGGIEGAKCVSERTKIQKFDKNGWFWPFLSSDGGGDKGGRASDWGNAPMLPLMSPLLMAPHTMAYNANLCPAYWLFLEIWQSPDTLKFSTKISLYSELLTYKTNWCPMNK